jgi:hypothetical protein
MRNEDGSLEFEDSEPAKRTMSFTGYVYVKDWSDTDHFIQKRKEVVSAADQLVDHFVYINDI